MVFRAMLTLFVSVDVAAKNLGVSARRLRHLLATGRIYGYKDERNIWRVPAYPEVRPGRRGPRMGKKPPKASAMTERSAGIQAAGVRKEECGKGEAREAAQAPSPSPCRRVSAVVGDSLHPVSKNYAK